MRRNYNQKELDQLQKTRRENIKLKKELAHLRKQIARIDLDRYETVTKMCSDYQESERFQESVEESNSSMENLKKTWACNDCESGYLEIFLYSKLGQTQYYRKCNSCSKRTVGKRYDSENVKGIIHK